MDRKSLMRINGSIQPRTTYSASVEFGLRTGETIILTPEDGSRHSRLLALLESAVATSGDEQRTVSGTVQVLASIESDGRLSSITSVPTFFADVEAISDDIGLNYYGSVDSLTDPVTKQ